MVVSFVTKISTALSILTSAYDLAVKLDKKFGVILLAYTASQLEKQKNELQELLLQLEITPDYLLVQQLRLNEMTSVCESIEASFLFVQLSRFSSRVIRKYLHAARELRIPYLFYKDGYAPLHLENVLVPVNFLIEEIEKAQFAAAFGRFCDSQITLLQANDYGSKAAVNVSKIRLVLDKFNLKYHVVKGSKDSFKIEFDAMKLSENGDYGLIIASSSRDYGLDDVIFGPKELHLIKKSKVPLMLINPRGDLYTLCD